MEYKQGLFDEAILRLQHFPHNYGFDGAWLRCVARWLPAEGAPQARLHHPANIIRKIHLVLEENICPECGTYSVQEAALCKSETGGELPNGAVAIIGGADEKMATGIGGAAAGVDLVWRPRGCCDPIGYERNAPLGCDSIVERRQSIFGSAHSVTKERYLLCSEDRRSELLVSAARPWDKTEEDRRICGSPPPGAGHD